MANDWIGYFPGRARIQQSGSIGGSRNVFVKLQGAKNELVFPTFGGTVMNPFKGTAKLYAGDLVEYRTDDKGVNPELYILKTFEVVSGSGTTVNIVRDGYHHIPFVGDFLMVAPEEIGGNGTAATVTKVVKSEVDVSGKKVRVWVLTLSSALTVKAGDVLVEGKASGNTAMLVENINAVCPCDYDFRFADVADPTADATDWNAAEYSFTPALGGRMYTHKMSPMPPCVKALNQSKVNGWFLIGETAK